VGASGESADEGVVVVDADQTIAEVELWVKMLERAGEIHEGLPDVIRARVDGQAMEAELMTLTVYMSSLSTRTRESFTRTCRAVLERLDATTQTGDDAEVLDFQRRQAL
jgi:hypothetical protein